jgi:hypothetical protein
MPSEKDLDIALSNELQANPEFLAWFIGHTKFASRDAVFHGCRHDNPWGSHPFPFVDPVTGKVTTSTRQSETDVLLIARDKNDTLLGVHIENKLGSGKFTDLQPEMYPHRAAYWLGNPRYGGYTEFDTVLVAPEAFRQRNTSQVLLFGCFVSYESVATFVPMFAQALCAA